MNPLEPPYITGDIILCNHFPHEKIRNHLTRKIEWKKHDMKQFILYMWFHLYYIQKYKYMPSMV